MKKYVFILSLSVIAFVVSLFYYLSDKNISEVFTDITSSSESEIVIGKDISDTATFIRAKDGDTYVIRLDSNGKEITVRLIGVDTPESVAPDEYYKDNTNEGREVSAIVKDKLKEGDKLSVEYDVQTEDKYGRTLAYLYLSDGQMIQEWLLTNGLAQVMTIQPNCKYAEYFITLQQEAIDNNIGLWKDLTFGNYIMDD